MQPESYPLFTSWYIHIFIVYTTWFEENIRESETGERELTCQIIKYQFILLNNNNCTNLYYTNLYINNYTNYILYHINILYSYIISYFFFVHLLIFASLPMILWAKSSPFFILLLIIFFHQMYSYIACLSFFLLSFCCFLIWINFTEPMDSVVLTQMNIPSWT